MKPEYPTYQEPLSHYPTIVNSTQFGYGRRTCTGQNVTDEDLLIGIGSIAWLFDIKKRPEESTLAATEPVKEHPYGLNKKATISHEELNAGITNDEHTVEEKILNQYTYPGSEAASLKSKSAPPPYKPLEWGDITKKPKDPTLDYSILLIAKPIPFEFDLKPRDTVRASRVRDLFREGVANGDYPGSREYWGENQGKDKAVGWSKV